MAGSEITSTEAYARMAGICSRSEQCSSDIRRKIQALGLDDVEAERIVDKLKEENFLNDERYVKAYVADKFRINKWGRIKMRYYLRAKGFNEDIIEIGFENLDEEKYKEALIKAMKEKARKVKKKSRYEKMGQIIRFAQTRGFEPELIHRYMNEVLE